MLGPVDAVLIGVRQGISIFSNISRSGTTVATGMFTCIEREQPEVSFAIHTCNSRGATIDAFLAQDTREAAEDLHLIRIESYAIGAVISAIVSYMPVRLVTRLVIGGKFYIFAFYCFAIGITTFFLL